MKTKPFFVRFGIIINLLFLSVSLMGAETNSSATNAPASGPATGMTVRFELFVKDTRAAADFYMRVLGFQCDRESGPYIQARNGTVRIGICSETGLPKEHYFSPEALQGRKGVGVEIVLEVADFDALYQRVLKSKYPLREGLVKRPWGLRDFRLVDTDGYYLRITERRE